MTTTNQALDFKDVGRTAAGVVGWVDGMPARFWQIALVVTILLMVPLFVRGRRAARRVGEHSSGRVSAGHGLGDNKKIRQEKQLLWASLSVAGAFWLAVLIGSGRGLAAFGRDTLHWHNGWDWLVPCTLDGVAVVFAFLAFRALVKQRNPDRARRIVWGATASSAFINFVHELTKTDGAALGAIYLGILSVLGMAMLDEFLRQFEEGAGYIKREKPVFGLRWLTLPYPTLCAWLAWTNYPPIVPTEIGPDGAERSAQITIRMAAAHLETVRSEKIAKRNELDAARSALPTWTRLAPWVRARKLQAMLDRSTRSMEQVTAQRDEEHRRSVEQMLAEHRTDMERITAEQRRTMERIAKERSAERAEQAEREQALQEALDEAKRSMERLADERSSEAEQARQLATQLSGASEQSGEVRRMLQKLQGDLSGAERQRGELAVKVERLSNDLRSANDDKEREAEQRRSLERALREMEQRSSEALQDVTERAERAERLSVERMEQLEALRDELTEQAERAGNVRSISSAGAAGARSGGARSTGARRGGSTVSDEDNRLDLALCFEKNGNDPDDKKAWSQRAVNRACNAGFTGRAQKLIDMAKAHIGECNAATHDLQCIAPAGELADVGA